MGKYAVKQMTMFQDLIYDLPDDLVVLKTEIGVEEDTGEEGLIVWFMHKIEEGVTHSVSKQPESGTQVRPLSLADLEAEIEIEFEDGEPEEDS